MLVDSLTEQLHSFASNFEISKDKIEMSVSKAEAETIIQENLADLNMGVNQWIREVYNLDGVKDVETPAAVQLHGKQPIITDIIPDPKLPENLDGPVDARVPVLSEFRGNESGIVGARTVRYATCVKVNERTVIGILVRQRNNDGSIKDKYKKNREEVDATPDYFEKKDKTDLGSKMTIAPSNIIFLFPAIKHYLNQGKDKIFANCVYEEG